MSFVAPVSCGYVLVNGILNPIGTALGDTENIVWIAGGWSVASAVAFSIAGGWSDIFGRRWVTLSGQVITLAGAVSRLLSLWCIMYAALDLDALAIVGPAATEGPFHLFSFRLGTIRRLICTRPRSLARRLRRRRPWQQRRRLSASALVLPLWPTLAFRSFFPTSTGTYLSPEKSIQRRVLEACFAQTIS